jgi:hypothetical protein
MCDLIFRSGLAILLLLAFANNLYGQMGIERQDYNTIFFRANNAYRDERYREAISEYESLIQSGLRGANILYNLGNAYLKIGNKGKALLYYERAFRLNPRDADIKSNLQFARTLVEGDTREYSKNWYERIFLFLRGFLSVDEMVSVVSASYFLVIIALALSILFKPYKRIFYYAAIFSLVIFIVSLPSFIIGVYDQEFQEKAVIMAEKVDARFEPNDDATTHFKLHEGSVVKIARSQGQWYQVQRYDGKTGWLKGEVFEII